MAAGKKYPLTETDTIVQQCVSQTALWGSCTVHLFTADITPALTDTLATYSGNEAGWTGYSPQLAAFGSVANDGTHSYTDSPVLTFTVTAGGSGTTVYGYYIVDFGGSQLIFAERIASPIAVVDGFDIQIQVRLRLYNA